MIGTSLQAFAARTARSGRISADDVKRLQRGILPDGVSSRDEAEILLGLCARVGQADRSFADWLTAALVDFVVWGERPTGTVDAKTACWLAPLLLRCAPEFLHRLVGEIAREAQDVDAALLSLVASGSERRSKATGFPGEPVRLAA